MKTQKVLETIFDNSSSFVINMNDTFYYASADSSVIDSDDMEDLFPIIEKYGQDVFVAYEAIKRGHDPVIPQSITDNFKKAKLEIQEILSSSDKYILFDLRYSLEEEKEPG